MFSGLELENVYCLKVKRRYINSIIGFVGREMKKKNNEE
jgi:hypothetical protein